MWMAAFLFQEFFRSEKSLGISKLKFVFFYTAAHLLKDMKLVPSNLPFTISPF
jgi:hypothetical protein